MPSTTTVLSSSWTVDDVLRCLPTSMDVIRAFGIDTCCGRLETLDVAARLANVRVEDLVEELNVCARSYEPLVLSETTTPGSSCSCCATSGRGKTVNIGSGRSEQAPQH